MNVITSDSLILRPGPEEPPEYAVLPAEVVSDRALQPEDLGILAWLLLRPPYADATAGELLADVEDAGWRVDGKRFAEILARLRRAGHLEEIEDDVFAVRRTPCAARQSAHPRVPRQAKQPAPKRTCFVYAIREAGRGRVKIGRSENPQARLKVLRTGSPVALELLWSTRGGVELEAFLHDRFADRRVRGEWFDFSKVDALAALGQAAEEFGGAQ
ncbi:GIY-YIG nuclease family protein [Streptomyces sp. MP131-18]|uniref:GIY-YIG nuclease family protein n=1 Tax=Streptomyces sp. MP131-18 TaxID=1857892 RepID=UPI001569ED6A|nr:GIY-YIG nuclease family protein [Streptomyces sp. MP131-18]